jgi:hypothetical protein
LSLILSVTVLAAKAETINLVKDARKTLLSIGDWQSEPHYQHCTDVKLAMCQLRYEQHPTAQTKSERLPALFH